MNIWAENKEKRCGKLNQFFRFTEKDTEVEHDSLVTDKCYKQLIFKLFAVKFLPACIAQKLVYHNISAESKTGHNLNLFKNIVSAKAIPYCQAQSD